MSNMSLATSAPSIGAPSLGQSAPTFIKYLWALGGSAGSPSFSTPSMVYQGPGSIVVGSPTADAPTLEQLATGVPPAQQTGSAIGITVGRPQFTRPIYAFKQSGN